MGLILREQLQLLDFADTTNGAGGATKTWAVSATVAGMMSALKTSRNMEKDEGGGTTVQELADAVIDTSTAVVSGAQRIKRSDGTLWEVIAITSQMGLSVCRCRKVITP